MKQPRFDLYEAADGWRWRLIAANNRTLAQGEAHTRKADADRAVDTVTAAVERIGHKAMIARIKAA